MDTTVGLEEGRPLKPQYGDVYKWNSTEFKVMYVSPGTMEVGWSGIVLTTDQGHPTSRSLKVSRDWVNEGVSEPVIAGDTYWVKIDAPQ